MWKWVGVGVEGIIGVPATDLTDEEFAKYNARVNAQHTADQIGALANSGLYEYVEDEKPNRKMGANEPKEESSTSADSTNTATVDKKSKDEDKKDE